MVIFFVKALKITVLILIKILKTKFKQTLFRNNQIGALIIKSLGNKIYLNIFFFICIIYYV